MKHDKIELMKKKNVLYSLFTIMIYCLLYFNRAEASNKSKKTKSDKTSKSLKNKKSNGSNLPTDNAVTLEEKGGKPLLKTQNIADELKKIKMSSANKKKEKLSPEEKKIKQIWMNSSFIPGLGQIYNKKIWKTGIIWLGLGGCIGGGIYFYKQYHKNNRSDINHRVFSNGLFVAAFFCYVLNVLDAYVDAHLSTYDISKKLTKPTLKNKKKTAFINKNKRRRKNKQKKR